MMRILPFLLILISSEIMAAGNASGHGSVKDLIYPFINVTLLFGFLFWKLKGPVSKMFTENAKKVEELAELADKKDQEADAQLKTVETKMAEVHNEMHSIVVTAKEDGDRFEKDHASEVQEQIARLKQDAEVKLMSEKAELIREINSKLLDEVINGAKGKIKSDSALQQKATSNLMARF